MAKKIGVDVDAGVLMFWILAGGLSAVWIIGVVTIVRATWRWMS